MTIAAAEILAHENVDPMTRGILHVVSILDSVGAREWSLRMVAVVTFGALGMIRMTIGKRYNIDWYALTHNAATGIGSVAAVYLDVFAAKHLTGTPEPLRSCLCGGPLTSLHRILPALTMGYGVLDLVEGLHLGPDFAAHGIATFSIMTFFVESDQPQIVVPFLMMEVSSIFLCTVRADFFNDTMSAIWQALFALTFFIFRIVVTPLIWVRLVKTLYEHSGEEVYQSCINPYVLPTSLLVGIFFHCLNAFWFYKICRKIKRKLSGKEKVRSRNDLKEKEDHAHDENKENVSANANVATNGHALKVKNKKTN